jgi:hypothetical protein
MFYCPLIHEEGGDHVGISAKFADCIWGIGCSGKELEGKKKIFAIK